jgi:hypothetical protein
MTDPRDPDAPDTANALAVVAVASDIDAALDKLQLWGFLRGTAQ